MGKNKSIRKKYLTIAAAFMFASTAVFANSEMAYVTAYDGSPIKNNYGQCWKSFGTFVPKAECGDIIKTPTYAPQTTQQTSINPAQSIEQRTPTTQPIVEQKTLTTQPIVVQPETRKLSINTTTVLFRFDSDILSTQARNLLTTHVVQSNPKIIHIHGHTDVIGTTKYNQALSHRRARSVFNFLIANGIDPNIIHILHAHGEASPICLENTRACHQQNRRVEVKTKH